MRETRTIRRRTMSEYYARLYTGQLCKVIGESPEDAYTKAEERFGGKLRDIVNLKQMTTRQERKEAVKVFRKLFYGDGK